MQFNSIGYMIFLVLIFVIYWSMPSTKRWIPLLVFSYYFYMSWEPKYIILIVFSTFLSYILALAVEKVNDKKRRKAVLIIGIMSILSILFIFKYFNFISDSLTYILRAMSFTVDPITLKLLLPVGISFYTFQTLSYLIDVYRGTVKAETHFGYYALFVSFFPQLVAGPIERPENLLPQLKRNNKFNYEQAKKGSIQIAIGLFKKMVIANTLAKGVDLVYNNLEFYSGFILIIATVMFAFQIYCDFGGYSDIAIGSAKLLNIDLMENFNCPYFSTSIKEFWDRWHISLSKWLRDYVYIPLGGSRTSKLKHYRNLMITFLLSGLWHGAEWTFVIWGGLHGLYLVFGNAFGRKQYLKGKRKKFIRCLLTFTIVSFAWIFFRANNYEDSIYVICNMFNGIWNPIEYLFQAYKVPHAISKIGTIVLLFEMLILMTIDYLQYRYGNVYGYLCGKKKFVRWLFYIIIILSVFLFSVKNAGSEFIYFQF